MANQKARGAGVYAAWLAALLCLATAVVYQLTYGGQQYYAAGILYVLAAAVPAVGLLSALRHPRAAAVAAAAISFAAILMFVYANYWDISVVMVGIDKTAFDRPFIVCSLLLMAGFVCAECALYLPVTRRSAHQQKEGVDAA